MPPASAQPRNGFTLLEILIAVTILGIIMFTIYGALSRSIFAKNRSEERAEIYAAGREAVLRMADELEGALPPRVGIDASFWGAPFQGGDAAPVVEFLTFVRRRASASESRGGLSWVSYGLAPQKGNRFVLWRQERLAADDTQGANGDGQNADVPVAQPEPILDQVGSFHLYFRRPESDDWMESWNATQNADQPPMGVPGAVAIELALVDDNGSVHDFDTMVDLPLAPPTPTPGP
jgi:type II secretion system protein J